jgi:hypothetical protein
VATEKKTPQPAARPLGAIEKAVAKGHLAVSELVSDRAAAPSPFGDDQTFPLPTTRVTYVPSSHW